MSDAEFTALTEKVRAKKAMPAEREAFDAECLRRFQPALAAQIEQAQSVPDMPLDKRQRLHRRAVEKAREEEVNRPTIAKYAEYLRLHAKDETRTKAETIRYKTLGRGHGWHGRPGHVVHDRRPARLPRPIRRDRTPRSRRVRTCRTSHGPPGREPDDPSLDPQPRVLFEHAAAFRGDPRVARWLEAWGDELAGGRS